jgi:hypothetical protein
MYIGDNAKEYLDGVDKAKLYNIANYASFHTRGVLP